MPRTRLPSLAAGAAFLVAALPAQHESELAPPVRLEADGKPIDIGTLSKYAHAGPALGDADGDGDRDLLVGDFPGNFWLFINDGTEKQPRYTSKGKLQAGGKDAKTPVY
jgi:hypothetical protein